ncbi:MAG TPA: hypothetical protein VIA06_06285 [Candidatus Dormibacteraeota bacterium]|jgi:hypothetical protein|nr:hypothetical protein [Candidatus Dormibacteraeota bacterium]
MDKLLNQGIGSTDRGTWYEAYPKVVKQIRPAVPVIPLYASDVTAAISPKFGFVGFNQYTSNGAYVLHIKSSSGTWTFGVRHSTDTGGRGGHASLVSPSAGAKSRVPAREPTPCSASDGVEDVGPGRSRGPGDPARRCRSRW